MKKNRLRKVLALVLACTVSASSAIYAAADEAEITAEMTALRSWVLTPGFSAEGEINGFAVNPDVSAVLYNAESGEFEAAELSEELVKGNFTALYDTDGDETADVIQVVSYADADTYWDASMAWCEGAGAADPGIDDETGFANFGAEQVIPYGERLLTGIGIGEWSGSVDFANVENITYWSNNDYYNAKSSDTLTILSGYKTSLQPTSWTCGLSSSLGVLEWYGQRGSLNAYDLANLRGISDWACGSPIETISSVFATLTELRITGEWVTEYSGEESYELFDPEWVQGHLAAGHPIMVMWNSFGWHWQTIIGYDNMGTEGTNDDVLIMMDPYDTTDQNANGYELESYERLAYGCCSTEDGGYTGTQFFVAYPAEGWEYTPDMGDGIPADAENIGVFTDDNKMSYGKTSDDIDAYYPDTEYRGDNGLAGAATGGYERSGDHENSPYWKTFDFFNMEPTDTLHIISGFETIQQATEWTCGLASSLMVMNHFGLAEDETDVSLSNIRQNGEIGATYLDGMMEVFTYMNDTYGQDWVWVSTEDLDDPDGEESYIGDYCLQAGTAEDWYGLIPYLIDNNIPVMIGSDEWGGHWQVIIGYDDMGTVDRTEDDVIILADPYDTTDHNQDGYYIDGFERLVYGWYSSFEPEYKHNDFIAAFPASQYADVAEALGIVLE